MEWPRAAVLKLSPRCRVARQPTVQPPDSQSFTGQSTSGERRVSTCSEVPCRALARESLLVML